MNLKKALGLVLSLACLIAPVVAHAGKTTATTTTLASSINPANINQLVNLTASVTPAISGGTVTFKDGTATLGTGTVSNGVATLPASFSTSGTHSLTAAYSGTTGYAASTSSAYSETVTTTVMTASSTTLVSSNNPYPLYGYITLTANVSPAAATGTVTFKEGSTILGTANVLNGVASKGSIYFSSVGTHNLTAVYSGDATYAGSASPALAESITIIPTTSTVDVSTGQYLSIGQTLSIFGYARNQWQSGMSGGTITLYDGTTQIGSGTPTYYGCCGLYYYLVSYTLPSGGTHSITAKYSGDANDAASTSAPTVLNVMQETIATTLQVSLTGSGPYYANAPVPVSAMVSPAASSATLGYAYPLTFGTVTLKDGSTTVGTITITGNSAGQYSGVGSVKFAASGAHTLTASYSGGYDFLASTLAKSIPVTVSAASATTTAINATSNPAAVGQSFTVNAAVTGTGPIPTGTVTFSDTVSRTTTTLGTVTLANGYAALPVSFAATGSHSITAKYSGDSANAVSTSAALALTVNTNASSTLSMTATPNPVAAGEPLLAAITTTGIANGSTVTVNDGATVMGTGTVSNGQTNITATLSTNGLHYITANYAGTSSVNASKSAPIAIQVGGSAGLTSPGAMTWLYSYDASRNLTGIVDPIGNTTTLGYDAFNNNTQITLPASNTRTAVPAIARQFDMQRNVISVTDPRNNTTNYSYDGISPLPSSTNSPDAGASSVVFDGNHNVSSTTDARGKTKTFGYDALNRLTSIVYTSGTPTTYEYDGGANTQPTSIGRLTKMTDESGSTSYAYDAYGNLSSKSITAGALAFNVSYTWGTTGTGAGKLASITYPSGSVVNYSYDANGRLASVTVNPVNPNGIGVNTATTMTVLSGVTYNAGNQPTGWNWAGGVGYARSYDSYGRASSYQLGNPAGTGISAGLTRTLTYDNAGQPAAYTHANSAGSQASFNHSYAYDGDSRLFGASIGNSWYGYDYDLNGNRTDRIVGSTDYQSTYSSSSNKVLQEQTLSGPASYSYDAAGNVTFDGAANYTYSDRGRMSSATVGGNAVNFMYNGLEQRVSKVGSLVPSGAAYYVYDEAGKLLGEYDANGSPIYETVYAGAMPVSVMKQSGSAGGGNLSVNLYNVYADQLGTPRVITRQSDSAIAWRWDMAEAFGGTMPDQNPNGLGVFAFNQRFRGQVFDSETGNFQNWFREYCPRCGRYLESDPIGLAGGWNSYVYASGNALTGNDPRGLDCVANGNSVSCSIPDGPSVSFPRPQGWPDNIDASSPLFHRYDMSVPLGRASPEAVQRCIAKYPTPGSSSRPATPGGTPNDANPTWFEGFVKGLQAYGGGDSALNPVLSYTRTSNGQTVVVNVTQPGHTLFPGYVARTVGSDGLAHNYGEGLGPLQSPYSPVEAAIRSTWLQQTQDLVDRASNDDCDCP